MALRCPQLRTFVDALTAAGVKERHKAERARTRKAKEAKKAASKQKSKTTTPQEEAMAAIKKQERKRRQRRATRRSSMVSNRGLRTRGVSTDKRP